MSVTDLLVERLAEAKATMHDWELDESGEIDEFAFSTEPTGDNYIGHNGPSCKRCGYYYCIWCDKVVHECPTDERP